MGGLIADSQEDYKILTLSMNQVFTVDELKQVKAKELMKKLDNEDLIKQEVMKLEGAKLTKINKEILSKIDFLDREFINREILFEDLLIDDKLHELSKSIGTIGLINPIYLIEKENGYKILSGFRRSTAIVWGFNNIENYNIIGGNNLVIIPSSAPYELLDTISLHENTLREDLTTLELSLKIWKESKHRKKKVNEIAQEYGISERSVSRYLRVEKYPKELLDKMDLIDNIKKADTIYSYLKKNSFNNISQLIKEVIDKDVVEIEKFMKSKYATPKEKFKIQNKKKKVIIEINQSLEEESLEKITNFIKQFL